MPPGGAVACVCKLLLGVQMQLSLFFRQRLRGLMATAAAVTLTGCATAPSGPPDACMSSGWLDRADAASMQAFSLRLVAWEPAQFDNNCTATADTPKLTLPQRLRLALAYGIVANPRRSHEQSQRLLTELGDKPSEETAATVTLIGRLLNEQNTREQDELALRRRLEESQLRASQEAERAEVEARRASEAQRRATLADEKLREAERRFAETNVKLNDATRRLEAMRAVEDALSRRTTPRRNASVTSVSSVAPAASAAR